ncbi:hypothetical protein OZ664_11605 [Elizabethkingia sp. HX WHF]|uniref:hypothetical protein n=1 Tax=Elizabethkingia sp. HX WHF TaxID=3003190 RepID=UPI002A24C0ED|nr:hypothetical protein [Elizabethkingia sp. HX WHF]MDX8564647.1 hypothetical protein [Elizabethkingia sp. HX WHF]
MMTEDMMLEEEKKESNILNRIGFDITSKMFGRPKKWHVGFFPAWLNIKQTDISLRLEISEEDLYSGNNQAAINAMINGVNQNSKLMCEYLALAILCSNFTYVPRFIRFTILKKWLVNHLLHTIDNAEIVKAVNSCFELNDYQSFTISTTAVKANRITKVIKAPEVEKKD